MPGVTRDFETLAAKAPVADEFVAGNGNGNGRLGSTAVSNRIPRQNGIEIVEFLANQLDSKHSIRRPLKTKIRTTGGTVCAGAMLMITFGAPSQNLFEASQLADDIDEFTPGGVQSTFASELSDPLALAFDSAGNLFVANYGDGNIVEITPGGAQSIFASGLFYPLALAFNTAGDLFEADEGSGNIYEFTPGGVQSTFASGLGGPHGLAFNSAGDLFASSGNSIVEITPGGVQSTVATGFSPGQLAFDRAGDLFVVNTVFQNLGGILGISSNILEFTPGGAQSIFASGLNGPDDLAFNSEGDLFESDSGTDKIFEFTPGGVQSTFASGLVLPEGLAFQGLTLPVPEPSTLALLAVGTAGYLVRRRR